AREQYVEGLLEVMRAGGIGEARVDIGAVALYGTYYHGHGFEPDKTVTVVDIGAEEVTTVICRDANLYYARATAGGGSRFTQAIADAMKTDLEEAERVKLEEGEIIFAQTVPIRRTAGGSGREPLRIGAGNGHAVSGGGPEGADDGEDLMVVSDEEEEGGGEEAAAGRAAPGRAEEAFTDADDRKRRISMALVREAAGLASQIEGAIAACRQQAKIKDLKIDKVLVSGGGSRLRGLNEFLQRRLRVPVEPLEPFRMISLDRLGPEGAEALREEGWRYAFAVGAAASALRPGAFTLNLWPAALKEKKEFLNRGLYVYYAFAVFLAALALFVITPWRNLNIISENLQEARAAVSTAEDDRRRFGRVLREHDRLKAEIEALDSRVFSGQALLNILAELKSPARTPEGIILTQVGTSLPGFLRRSREEDEDPIRLPPGNARTRDGKPAALRESETFQVRGSIYIRGFARSQISDSDAQKKVREFMDRLVPNYANPDDERNLFKDARTIYLHRDEQKDGAFFLKEFVVRAWVASESPKSEAEDLSLDIKEILKVPSQTPPEGTKKKRRPPARTGAAGGDTGKAEEP
ncbi:MAG: cell division FtsA domain-containing protein, partial [Planctomycetota bacterium]|nr:cell division FtsA domain-containing protein [Planctomycetota bacterium]